VVTTYLKQLRLSRMARDCEPLARCERQGRVSHTMLEK
jgi:hypothetical protein